MRAAFDFKTSSFLAKTALAGWLVRGNQLNRYLGAMVNESRNDLGF